MQSETEQFVREALNRFLKTEMSSLIKGWDEKGEYPSEIMKKLADLGIMGLRVPTEYGGLGKGLLDSVLILEMIAKVDASTAINLHIQLNASPIFVREYGSEKIKKKFLPPLVEGQLFFSMAQTESHAGSNLHDLRTTAQPDGDDYVVNGTKCMISMGKSADIHLVYVKFKDDQSIGCLVIEKWRKGFSLGRKEDFLGLRGLDSAELVFEDCRVPRENILVKGNGSLKKMMTLFDGSRVGLAAISFGIATAAFEETLKYSKIRTISGKPLIEYQGIQWKLADMAIKLEEMKHLIHSAANDVSMNGFPSAFSSSAAKIVASEGALEIANTAMSIFGSYGYSKEFPIEKFLRDARGTTYIGGTPEVLRNAIAAHLRRKSL